MSSFRGSSEPRDRTHITYTSAFSGSFFTTGATWEGRGHMDLWPWYSREGQSSRVLWEPRWGVHGGDAQGRGRKNRWWENTGHLGKGEQRWRGTEQGKPQNWDLMQSVDSEGPLWREQGLQKGSWQVMRGEKKAKTRLEKHHGTLQTFILQVSWEYIY